MKNLILLLSILLLFTSCATKQNTVNQENIEQTILAMEYQALDRWSAGDPLGFAENFADDATYFDDIGAQERIDGLEIKNYLKSFVGKIPPHTYELVKPKVQVYDDIAIVTLLYYSKLGDEPNSPWKATDVYRLTNGKWQVVHANWSTVKEE